MDLLEWIEERADEITVTRDLGTGPAWNISFCSSQTGCQVETGRYPTLRDALEAAIEMDRPMKLSLWIKLNQISMYRADRVDRNPRMPDARDMDHWRVYLFIQDPDKNRSNASASLIVNFSMGRGHAGRAPRIEEVLSCLQFDARSGQLDFGEFCSELGYEDNAQARRTHKNCERQYARLQKFLGEDLLEEFMSASSPAALRPRMECTR